MSQYALVENGVVVNLIVWDGDTEWDMPSGQTAVEVKAGDAPYIGLGYANGAFAQPTPAQETDTTQP